MPSKVRILPCPFCFQGTSCDEIAALFCARESGALKWLPKGSGRYAGDAIVRLPIPNSSRRPTTSTPGPGSARSRPSSTPLVASIRGGWIGSGFPIPALETGCHRSPLRAGHQEGFSRMETSPRELVGISMIPFDPMIWRPNRRIRKAKRTGRRTKVERLTSRPKQLVRRLGAL